MVSFLTQQEHRSVLLINMCNSGLLESNKIVIYIDMKETFNIIFARPITKVNVT